MDTSLHMHPSRNTSARFAWAIVFKVRRVCLVGDNKPWVIVSQKFCRCSRVLWSLPQPLSLMSHRPSYRVNSLTWFIFNWLLFFYRWIVWRSYGFKRPWKCYSNLLEFEEDAFLNLGNVYSERLKHPQKFCEGLRYVSEESFEGFGKIVRTYIGPWGGPKDRQGFSFQVSSCLDPGESPVLWGSVDTSEDPLVIRIRVVTGASMRTLKSPFWEPAGVSTLSNVGSTAVASNGVLWSHGAACAARSSQHLSSQRLSSGR